MQLPYFYFNGFFEDKGPLQLPEDTSKHIVQVLRMEAGEQLQLTDGKGSLATCMIIEAHKKHCTVSLNDIKKQAAPETIKRIAISPLKNASRFEWFLEKATELGINEIIPILSRRTEKASLKTDRLHNILVSAMLQSRQVFLPLLHEPTPFSKHIENGFTGLKLIAHCLPTEKKHLTAYRADGNAEILIGPEGDFSEEETALAINRGYMPVSLGSQRLRTETAGIAAAVLLVNHY